MSRLSRIDRLNRLGWLGWLGQAIATGQLRQSTQPTRADDTSAAPACPQLSVTDLSIAVAGQTLVRALTLTGEAGQRWALLGVNGAGKSTLLHTLAGLRRPQAGDVRTAGQPLHQMSGLAQARLRAFAQQQPDDAFSLPVIQFVAQARSPFESAWRLPNSDSAGATRDPIVDAALQAADVAHLAARDIRQLSGGERQRVGIAAALAQNSPWLMLDEPTAHLDPAHQMQVMRYLAGLSDRLLIVAMHDVNLALRFCTHAVLLHPDRTEAGPIGKLINAPALQSLYGTGARIVSLPSGDQTADYLQVVWL